MKIIKMTETSKLREQQENSKKIKIKQIYKNKMRLIMKLISKTLAEILKQANKTLRIPRALKEHINKRKFMSINRTKKIIIILKKTKTSAVILRKMRTLNK